jgi:hypothetical protein
VSTLAAFPKMLEHGWHREGLRVCRAAWLFGLTVREYREIEAGDRMPPLDTYDWISSYFGWPGSSRWRS